MQPGSHEQLFADLLEALKRHGTQDTSLLGGGPIPVADAQRLEAMGVKRFFLPGATGDDIADFLRASVGEVAQDG